jgi:hypothetical protein
MRRTPAIFLRYLFVVAVVTSLIKAENVLSASAQYDAQRIPVTVELVLDHMPEYSIFAWSSPDYLSTQSDDVSGTLDCTMAYRNARVCHAQKVRALMMVHGNPVYASVPQLLHRSLPGESPDDGLMEIG